MGSGGGTTTPIATYVYGYDSANRVTTMVDAEGTYTYTYDNANELTGVDKNGTQVESYSYDLNGNRTGTGYSTTVMNETATSPGITYSYDNAGNMITAKNGTTTTTYTYDFDNRLTGVTQNGTVIATYVYDALGRRIGVDDNGTQTWTVYDGTNPYADFNGSGTLQVRYQYGPGVVDGAVVDQLLARTSSGGTTAWYLPDKLGSVRDIVSTSGTELDHVVYDSFGNIVTETDAANGDRFKFAGMEYDSATGGIMSGAGDFDPLNGDFSSSRSRLVGTGQVNLYVYVADNPLNGVDPTRDFRSPAYRRRPTSGSPRGGQMTHAPRKIPRGPTAPHSVSMTSPAAGDEFAAQDRATASRLTIEGSNGTRFQKPNSVSKNDKDAINRVKTDYNTQTSAMATGDAR